MKIYVGNLAYKVTDEELRAAFSPFGEVASATIIKDQFSGQSKGFGFVEMPSQAEAQAAITGLHEKEFHGRTLTVNEARPRADKPRGGKPGGGRSGGRSAGREGSGEGRRGGNNR